MKLLHLGMIVTAGVLLAACSGQTPSDSSQLESLQAEVPAMQEVTTSIDPAFDVDDQQAIAEEDAMTTKTYTPEEIATHSTADDCWFAIEGKVYDATPYIADQKHPGGAAILEGCGKDATELFNTRPMGSGTAHSDQARAGLEDLYIGDLAE